MRILDLFSGIGGFSLGLERAGMRTVAFCEIDPFCREVLGKHWPDITCSEDITAREFEEGEADIVCGGFPCQDISLAGEGAGLAGSRSGLWRELLRAIRVVRPRYAIVENVAALLGRGMGTILGDLAEIGYDVEWHCIPASTVGAPHRRDRVWIVADAERPGLERRPPLAGYIADELAAIERGCEALPDTACARCDQSVGAGEAIHGTGSCQSAGQECCRRNPWVVEPDVGRVADGIPARVDRLRSLGNAVVPQIPEIIGRAIMKLS